jgi:hypothetical protein
MLAEAALLVTLTVQHGADTDECLSAASLQRSVEKRLKRRVFVEPRQAQLRLGVRYLRGDAGIEARISLASADGTPRGSRSLTTEGHCSTLDDSLALSVALLVDQPPDPEPEAPPASPVAEERPQAAPTPSPTPTPVRRAPPTPIAIPVEVAAPREPWHARVGVAAASAFQVLPQLEPAAVLRFTLVPARFVPLTLQGEAFSTATAQRDGRAGARFRLLRVGLSGCPEVLGGGARVAAVCVGQKMAWMSVEGFGFDRNGRDRRMALSLTLGGEGRIVVFGPFSLRAYLGAEVPLVRDSFASAGRGATRLFRPSPVAVAGEIGLEAALW